MIPWDARKRLLRSVLDTAGLTPLVRLARVVPDPKIILGAKLEYFGPSGSLKDRILPHILAQAEARGDLRPGMSLIEGTTGNTGIATAMAGAARGYPVTIVMPEGMSHERQAAIRAYGAELLLTPGGESDVDLVLARVAELKAAEPERYFEIGQFTNADNAAAHYAGTGPEIWEQSDHQVDLFVAGVGSGGTLSGVARYLKEQKPAVSGVAVEPAECPLLSRGAWGSHTIEGIGDGLLPDILDLDLVDAVAVVHSDDALAMARRLAREEGIFCGPSSGANVLAACAAAAHLGRSVAVTIIADNGLRYLSTDLTGHIRELESPRRPHPLNPVVQERLATFRRRAEIIPV
jgi:cysteine synthase A